VETGVHEPKFLRVRNWERYQVYHDGRPTRFFYIHVASDPKKGIVGIFDNPAFLKLADDPECPVFRVMAYAAVTGNKIPNDESFVRAKLFTERRVNLEKMVAENLLEPWVDSQLLQDFSANRTEPYESVPRREEKREEEKEQNDAANADVQAVYDHWRVKLGKTDARYAKRITPNRRKKIAARLREFTSEELIRAIDGVALDPWQDRPRHNDLTIVFRSQENVEKFIELAGERKSAHPCSRCGMGFRTSALLNDHMENVHHVWEAA
jgi:hypothetical protein